MHAIGANWLAHISRVLGCACLVLLAPVVQAAEEDPWEGFNRAIFSFNDTLDTYALKPLAQGYEKVTPEFLQDGIHNVFGNIGEVGNLSNNLLQGKLHDAGVDSSRLIFNTSFGVLGFFDVATKMGLRRNDEDFGQTLGAWGVQSGPYLVLPLMGPGSVRDTAGRIPDSYLQPYPHMAHIPTRNVTRGVALIDMRASLLSAERMVSGDKYLFVRNAYLQNREFRVKDGQVEDDF